MKLLLLSSVFLAGCASLRSSNIIPLQFSSQPPRVSIRGACNGKTFTTQGEVVCEEKVPADGTVLTVSSELGYGDGGPDVRVLQIQLNAHGATLALDNNYGSLTMAAVKAFQQTASLPVTGVADTATLKALGITVVNMASQVFVKIPPLQGRIIFANGQMKETTDFNWYPKEGFFIWRKTPIKDTWIPLNLGDIATTFGDWPVALDVTAVDPKVGVIVTRGILYYRVCNDKDVICSRMVVNFSCDGHNKATSEGNIGKCERLSGSSQSFLVPLKTDSYQATPGAKIYFAASRTGLSQSYTPTQADFDKGYAQVEIPSIQPGPTLVTFAMDWIDDSNATQHVETRVLMVGFDPSWTGLDDPHYMDQQNRVRFVRPVMSDIMEADVYEGQNLVHKDFSDSDSTIDEDRPSDGQVACAFAWQRESSDQTVTCVDKNLNEVPVP